ncbi:MAG: TetR/AcrR family transcriptional regulator [Bacteroidetes bacterium]|nr:TetR/AcrR family transcriptional regulator [Bacteroidota bacterium]MBL7103445.1 TetR/AcrR family transcriptional regulator [Bacteroidales bacterium]
MSDFEKKYKTIIEGAYNIFAENGIRNVSMDDISRSLGISKKTLYRCVENKIDLIRKVFAYVKDQIFIRMEEMKKMDMNAIDVLLEMSKIANIKHYNINPVISFELQKFYPQVYKEYFDSKKELIINYIKNNIEKGIKEGLYRQDLNKEVIAHLYFQKIEDIHKTDFFKSENFSFETVFKVMFENHIRGISNQKGIEYFERQKEKLNFNI